MSIYETLYDWQKPFVDNYLNKDKWGYFLDMSIGKTKITMAAAEKHHSDVIIVISILSKVTEEMQDGSFACEAVLGGYQPFYSHKVKGKRYQAEFEKAILAHQPLCYIMNYAHLKTKLGMQIFYTLCQRYHNVTLILDEAHHLKSRSSGTSKLLYNILYSERLPQTQQPNVARQNIRHVYMATGTPFTTGYHDFYMLIRLLGHPWKWNEFTNFFCVMTNHKMGPRVFNTIERYKNEDKLFEIINRYACFAKTDDYYKFLPEIVNSFLYVQRSSAYWAMANPSKKNRQHKVFGGYVCDTAALFKLRLRQLACGYMGNGEAYDVYDYTKIEKLTELLTGNYSNYVIFYNYTPELDMILTACSEAGYVWDIWNGETKSLAHYNDLTQTKGKVVVANLVSGSEGMNLPRYQRNVFFSLPDTFAAFNQAMRRTVRLSSTFDRVFNYIILATKTVEMKIWERIGKREDYDDHAFENDYWNAHYTNEEELDDAVLY